MGALRDLLASAGQVSPWALLGDGAASVFLLVFVVAALRAHIARQPWRQYAGSTTLVPTALVESAPNPVLVEAEHSPPPPSLKPVPKLLVPKPKPERRRPPPKLRLDLSPFKVTSTDADAAAAAHRLETGLVAVLPVLAPHIAVQQIRTRTLATSEARVVPLYNLDAEVQHLGDRIRVRAEMTDAATGAALFRLRYQGLPSEEDKVLAEITANILKSAPADVALRPLANRRIPG